MSERLVAFLYVLMRDEVVSGAVERVMESHIESRPRDIPRSYSNPHLEAYARELAERLS